MAPFFELSLTMTAAFPPFQAAMTPCSVTKMNFAAVLPGKAKSVVPLATIPVGLEGGLAPGGTGMVTMSPCLFPAPLNKVARPVWLFDNHHVLVALRVKPHGLMS